MAVNGITISGFKEYADRLNQLATTFPQDLDDAAKFAAQRWERNAKLAAPKDVGFLSGGISSYAVTPGVWEVASAKAYSPFMEWGTKLKVNVPADISSYASQFKGQTSTGDPKALIYVWVLRKGLPVSAQWPIFISIMRTGVNPHPFFFIQKPIIEAKLLEYLKQMVESL